MAKHEYYVVQGKTLDNIAGTMKTVLGVDKDTPIRFDEITNNEKAEQVTENVDAQAEVIEQIKAALNGKSSIGVKEIMDIIDQSGVLNSTDGTAVEKVEQLIDLAELKPIIQDTIDTIGGPVFQNWQLTTEQVGLFDFSKTPSMSGTFRNNKVITSLFINAPQATALSMMVNGCSNLKTVVLTDTSKVGEWSNSFVGATNIESIETLNFISAYSWLTGAFANLPNLITIKIVPETIPTNISFARSSTLNDESIQSIIDGLATVETAQTLTLHADVKAKLTDEQLATITGKNWNLA